MDLLKLFRRRAYNAKTIDQFADRLSPDHESPVIVRPLTTQTFWLGFDSSDTPRYSTRFETELPDGRNVVYTENYGKHNVYGPISARENNLRHFATLDARVAHLRERLPKATITLIGNVGEISADEYARLRSETTESGFKPFK